MATIDIGPAAINRSGADPFGFTNVLLDNPANDSGTISSFEVWAATNITGFRAGTFYLVSGTTYKCRDSETIGSVTAGSKQTFSGFNCNVVTGDYIGYYFTAGTLEWDTSGYAGLYYIQGEYIDPNDQATYTLSAGDASSLYGTGQTAVTAKTSSDTGSGADAVYSLETPEAKSSSDAGSGVEGAAVPSAILVSSETGSGIEGLITRLLAALDTGGGAEASSIEIEGLFKALFASELGQGGDCLVAKIEMPTKGGGMKLWT